MRTFLLTTSCITTSRMMASGTGPTRVRSAFGWNLANLVHFPNVAGPRTFNGVTRWAKTTKQEGFERQYRIELLFAFGLTGLLMVLDFWTTLFFVCVPQLYGARCILRINILQHDGADISSEWNHSRNFVGRAFNWIMCNNGYHTIHHNRAGLHWSESRRGAPSRRRAAHRPPASISAAWWCTWCERTCSVGAVPLVWTDGTPSRPALAPSRSRVGRNDGTRQRPPQSPKRVWGV